MLIPRIFAIYGEQPRAQFRDVQPGQLLDYQLPIGGVQVASDATFLDILDGGDFVASAAIACRPSGALELQLSRFSVAGTVATVWLGGGLPGREYLLRLTLTMTSGRVYQIPVLIDMSSTFLAVPNPPPTSMDFGVAVTWTYAPISAPGVAATLPANAVLRALYIQNMATTPMTGGLNIGSTLNGVDIAAAIPIAGSAMVPINSESLLAQWFSASVAQPIYFSAAGAWNGASLNVRIVYDV